MSRNIDLKVSDHAVVRYLERFHHELMGKAIGEINEIIHKGAEVRRKDEAFQLMKNGYKKDRYYRKNDKVLVVSETGKIKTVLEVDNPTFKKYWKHVL